HRGAHRPRHRGDLALAPRAWAAVVGRGWTSVARECRVAPGLAELGGEEARMPKKCVACDILLDVPCPNADCRGDQNESVVDLCVYCATNARENMSFLRRLSDLLPSSLVPSAGITQRVALVAAYRTSPSVSFSCTSTESVSADY